MIDELIDAVIGEAIGKVIEGTIDLVAEAGSSLFSSNIIDAASTAIDIATDKNDEKKKDGEA